jgi:hypothetical protein
MPSGVAQGVGPEFKPQYPNTEKKKKERKKQPTAKYLFETEEKRI